MPCSTPGCIRPTRAKGLCGAHYERQRATGAPPTGPVGRYTAGGTARLSERVLPELLARARARAAAAGVPLRRIVEAALEAYLPV